jgi:hypothetical protein
MDSTSHNSNKEKWVTLFLSEGIESVTDEERSGRPATSKTEENIATVRQIMRENLRLPEI